MKLIKLVVCASVLVSKICFAELIIKFSKLDDSSLIEASINTLTSCYADRFSTVGLAGPSVGRIMTKISSSKTVIPVTLIDGTSRVNRHTSVPLGSRYKLQIFVITVINPKVLITTITRVKRSKWWNHMASFLLIDSNIVANGCSRAAEILLAAWKIDLLNSKFLCFHRKRGRLIYTFNPYTDNAPKPWQRENTHRGMYNHPWTLFVREYREDDSLCDEIDFDKTVNLGGYPILPSAQSLKSITFRNTTKRTSLNTLVQIVAAQTLMKSLNAYWKLPEMADRNRVQKQSGTDQKYNFMTEVASGLYDLRLQILTRNGPGNNEFTYSFHSFQVAILTRYPDHESHVDKIISVFDGSSQFGVFLVLMITLLFLKCWLRRPLTFAILDPVLTVYNPALYKIPKRLAPKIYLCSLLIFVVTIRIIYQGKFTSLLTKQKRLSTIDTIEDLARSDYKICGAESFQYIFDQSTFEGRYVVSNNSFRCADYMRRDSKVAYVDVVTGLTDLAERSKLRLSREIIGHLDGGYIIRPDWPLEERVNLIFGRAAAGGIMEAKYRQRRDNLMNVIKSYEEEVQNPKPKVLTMKQLTFAFVILGIGLGCATITFIIEVAFFS